MRAQSAERGAQSGERRTGSGERRVVAHGGWVLAETTVCGGVRVPGQRTRRATFQCSRWLLRGWNQGLSSGDILG